MIQFNLDAREQGNIESVVERVILSEAVRNGNVTINGKDRADEYIVADESAQGIYSAGLTHGTLISEEGNGANNGEPYWVMDPIDGSSEFNRIGPRSSPLATAVIEIADNSVIAASVGDIWNEKIYGIDENGLYVYSLQDRKKQYLEVSNEKRSLELKDARFAAYHPTYDRLELATPLYYLNFPDKTFVCNNGGHFYALNVIEGQTKDNYSAALEAKPKEMWEQIGPIMAMYGGACVSRLDGTDLCLDVNSRQSSVTAANDKIRLGIIKALKPNYEALGIEHLERI